MSRPWILKAVLVAAVAIGGAAIGGGLIAWITITAVQTAVALQTPAIEFQTGDLERSGRLDRYEGASDENRTVELRSDMLGMLIGPLLVGLIGVAIAVWQDGRQRPRRMVEQRKPLEASWARKAAAAAAMPQLGTILRAPSGADVLEKDSSHFARPAVSSMVE